MHTLKEFIPTYNDFPKKGILFKDVLEIVQEPEIFREVILKMSSSQIIKKSQAIISIDARGFIFGSALAYKLKLGMVMIRKKNKLPGKKISFEYDLEYGKDILEINISVENKKFLLIDDLLATGGTANAAVKLIEKAGGNVSCFGSLIELSFLNGRNKLSVPVRTLIKY